MRLPGEAQGEVARCVADLVDDGVIEGKVLRGDNQVLDVDGVRLRR